MSHRIRRAACLLTTLVAGCGDKPATSPDYSNKPEPGREAPYVPKNHKNAIDKTNKGPTQPYPRTAGGNP